MFAATARPHVTITKIKPPKTLETSGKNAGKNKVATDNDRQSIEIFFQLFFKLSLKYIFGRFTIPLDTFTLTK